MLSCEITFRMTSAKKHGSARIFTHLWVFLMHLKLYSLYLHFFYIYTYIYIYVHLFHSTPLVFFSLLSRKRDAV